MKQITSTILALLIVSASSFVFAHGDESHAKKVGPVKLEQKPWGIAGDAKVAKRIIEVAMTDAMRFTPEKIEIREGETVKLVIKNNGEQLHEFVIGTKKELDEHAALMLKFPTMEHDEPYMAHVAPGKTGVIIWTFNKAGTFDFACLIAGHHQAGMVGKINVASVM